MKKIIKRTLIALLVIAIAAGVYGLWIYYGTPTSNPDNHTRVGDIPAPSGFERTEDDFTFERNLPLKPKGAKVELVAGGNARMQSTCYAVVDLPMLSNAEQCADVCMRLRAEKLFAAGQYSSIRFKDVNGNTLQYRGGASRNALNNYLRNLYGVASTFSLARDMKPRAIKDIRPGDVFVYPAPAGLPYGHAIMVVDVLDNGKGQKALLLAEGNTPARNIHIMRNTANPFTSPWFIIDDDDTEMLFSVFRFKASDLKHF